MADRFSHRVLPGNYRGWNIPPGTYLATGRRQPRRMASQRTPKHRAAPTIAAGACESPISRAATNTTAPARAATA